MDSAAGSAREARDPKTQAILPIFGKVKNAIKGNMTTTDVIKNDKLGLALAAFRCGIGNEFDIHKLRYHKIILMSDADCFAA